MLSELIEAHKNALAQFDTACESLDDVTGAYEDMRGEHKITLYNATFNVSEGRDWLRDYADNLVDKCGGQIPFISAMSPEFAEQFTAFLDTARQSLYDKIDEAIAEDERRQEAFGVTAAKNEWKDKSDAETAALHSICRYRCADHEEERERIRYILECPSAMGCCGTFPDLHPVLVSALQQA